MLLPMRRMQYMYTRGQFAVIAKVGRKALRIYEEKGILVPIQEDPLNGYHYYSEEQLEELRRIQKYKKYGLSLNEIADIILHGMDEAILLKEHNIALGNSIRNDLMIKSELEQQLKGMPEKKKTQEYIFRTTSFIEQSVLCRQENIDREQLGISVGKLHEEAVFYHLTVNGPHFVIYDKLLEQEGDIDMTVCLPIVVESTKNLDIEQKNIRSISFENCIHTIHITGFSNVGAAHEALLHYAKENQITLAGSAIERYNTDYTVDIYYTYTK